MENINPVILLPDNPSYILLIILMFLIVFILSKKSSIKICLDYKKGKIIIKVKKKQK